MNTQKENSHTDKTKSKYVFAQKGNADYSSIKLTEGKFKDVIYHYGKVQLAKEEEELPDGRLPMRFDYTVIENDIEADTDSQEFIDHIGDVLVVLLEEQMKEMNESA